MAEQVPHRDGGQPLPSAAPDVSHSPDAHFLFPPAEPETFELDVDALGLTAQDRIVLGLDMAHATDSADEADIFGWGIWG